MDVRIKLDMYIQQKVENRTETLTARLFSYNENENEIFQRYVLESVEPNHEQNGDGTYKYVNVGIIRKFAKNNNIKLGDTLSMGYGDYHINLYVNEIVETAEAIYPRANEYVWSDNQKFGYIYIEEVEFGRGLTNFTNAVLNAIASKQSEEEKQEIRNAVGQFIELFGLPNILDPNVDGSYVSKYGNQLIIKNLRGYSQEEIMPKVKTYLEGEGISVKKAITGELLPYRVYMANAQRQLNIATVFLPVFFYSVTMIIIGLFMNQIIKAMTPDIGIMVSIGVDKKEIISLFLMYALLMGIVSGILGVITGYGIYCLLTSIMVNTYSIPILSFAIHPLVTAVAIIGLVIFAELATFLSCLAIFKITPKDAVISNEAKRKKNPKIVDKIIEKSPMTIKLGLNSIFQNPKRFFVSVFSMIASFVLTMLCCNFFISKETMIDQSVHQRLNYDCQVYMQEISTDEQINEIKNLDSVSAFEDCYYTYLNVKAKDDSTYIEALGVNENSESNLVVVPDKNGHGDIAIPNEGLIIPKSYAAKLHVKIGDMVSIGGIDIEIKNISYQYFHPIAFLSKTQMKALSDQSTEVSYVSSFLINVKDRNAFDDYFVENQVQCLTVYTENLAKDLYAIFNTINIMIFIMIGFAFGIGFIILCIMSQNTLMEQKRPVSVLRLIGFRIKDVSNFWSLQSISQLIFSLLFAIPGGLLASYILFTMASAPTQTYPFIISWQVMLISFGFVLLTVLICHSLAMISIRKWNLADNTRSRE